MPLRFDQYFEPGGLLANKLPGFDPRPQQTQVATAIAGAMRSRGIALVEAATGVGKTLAYLIPALMRATPDRKVVISTHTLALQGQLLERDLPFLQSIWPKPFQAALLKGRGNYLCLQDYDAARSDIWTVGDIQFAKIGEWSKESKTGDVAELDFSYPGWADIRANPDTCKANDCRFFDKCFYYKGRDAAAEASVIVVNHALFFSDLAMRSRGDFSSTLLPDYDFVIFDEAHHLETAAAAAFGVAFASSRIPTLVDRVRRLARSMEIDRDRLTQLDAANQTLFAPFTSTAKSEFMVDEIIGGAQALQDARVQASNVGTLLDRTATDLLKQPTHGDPATKDRIDGLRRQCVRAKEEIQLVFGGQDENYLRWGALGRAGRARSITLNWTPIMLAPLLAQTLWSKPRAIGSALVSATLATDGGFDYLRGRLGIPKADDTITETIVGSTFDFRTQSLVYLPRHLAPPSEQIGYMHDLAEEIIALINLSKGGVFALFTSHRALGATYDRLVHADLPYPLFRQGEMPNARLVEGFRAAGNGVLLGTASFWEGVDVPGQALRLVIIDRIPFAMPDNPLHKARVDRITEAGGDWFGEYALPQAELRLKQGFGRLVRTTADRGVVALLDSRLITKRYGARILASLPPSPRVHKIEDVARFFGDTPGIASREEAVTGTLEFE